VDETFAGSLPAFLAAFTSKKKLTDEEITEIRKLIDKAGE
jgi:predicted transcriptional regulator